MVLLEMFRIRTFRAGLQPSREDPDGRLVLSYDWTMGLTAFGFLGLGVFFFLIPYLDDKAAPRALVFFVLGALIVSVGLWVAASWRLERIAIDAKGGIVLKPFRDIVEFQWADVRATSWLRLGYLRLHLDSGHVVHISPLMNGFRDAALILIKATPESVHRPGLSAANAHMARLVG